MVKDRESNFELMRIVSTFFIVLWHVILCGKGLEFISQSTKLIFDIILAVIAVHVNSYILLTGYFNAEKKKNNRKSFFNALNISWFYRFIITVILVLIGAVSLTKLEFLQNVFILPLNHEHWFIHHYLLLCLISPFLNKLIQGISQNEYKKLLITIAIINSIIPYITNQLFFSVYKGFSLYHFIFLYLIGGYIKMYPIKNSYHFKNMGIVKYRNILIFGFFFIAFINLATISFGNYIIDISSETSILYEIGSILKSIENTYDFILTIIQSVIYLLIFSTINIKSRIINKISRLTLGIYLIHESELLKPFLYDYFKFNSMNNGGISIIVQVLITTIKIFVICGIIELIRITIFGLIKKVYLFFKKNKKNINLHTNLEMLK